MECAIVRGPDVSNPDEGDMLLVQGTAVLTSDLGEEVDQRVRVRLNFWKGDYFLDTREGMPWIEQIFEKGVDPSVIRAVFSQVILGAPGIAALDELTWAEDALTRSLSLRFSARLTSGRVFFSADYAPFLVSL